MSTGVGRLSLADALEHFRGWKSCVDGRELHVALRGGADAGAEQSLGSVQMHLKWWWNPWVDGQVDVSVTQLSSMKSVLPSVKIGVSVGKHHGGRFIRFMDPPTVGLSRDSSFAADL